MKKTFLLLLLISLIACTEKSKTINKQKKSIYSSIYSSNDVVKVDGLVSFKRDMSKVTGTIHGFHSNGNQKEAYEVLNGKLNGFRNSWNEVGEQSFEGHYKNGMKEGTWRIWWPNRQLRSVSNYKNDQLNGIRKRWSMDGKFISEDMWIGNNKQ
jgi:antitoxin component YwqK of YwqJK toxin-antitoxin module